MYTADNGSSEYQGGYRQRPAEYGRPNHVFYDNRKLRKPVRRRTVDYTSTVIRYLEARTQGVKNAIDAFTLHPTASSVLNMMPPMAYPQNPANSYCTKFVHSSTNKVRCSINRVMWDPPGRRLITGSQSGEFTLWNGQCFNFEMILQAHDVAIRAMVWSHNENWIVTGDHSGCIKYWQPNMNNVKAKADAHKEAVRDISFSPTDLKFVSCSDDHAVKVWDFATCSEEAAMTGHGGDVKSVDWHPTSSLLVSGAKDNLVKLWDARTASELATLHGHKNNILSVKWNENGNWVLTASRDNTIKLYDIRTLQEVQTFRGHKKEVTALAWHPVHESLFASGGYDGSIMFWSHGLEGPQAEVVMAHDSAVWDLAWHPLGHMLASGSNDHSTKFWCRSRPGDGAGRKQQGSSHTQGTEEKQKKMVDAVGLVSWLDTRSIGTSIPGLGIPTKHRV